MNHFIINPRMFNAYKQHSHLLLSRMQRAHFTLLTSNLGRRVVCTITSKRTIKIGKYIVETRKTVRVIAKEFGVSKSTVHKDLTERLPEINPELANEVKEILDYHKSIRHLEAEKQQNKSIEKKM